jgi:hypothetical protein
MHFILFLAFMALWTFGYIIPSANADLKKTKEETRSMQSSNRLQNLKNEPVMHEPFTSLLGDLVKVINRRKRRLP